MLPLSSSHWSDSGDPICTMNIIHIIKCSTVTMGNYTQCNSCTYVTYMYTVVDTPSHSHTMHACMHMCMSLLLHVCTTKVVLSKIHEVSSWQKWSVSLYRSMNHMIIKNTWRERIKAYWILAVLSESLKVSLVYNIYGLAL